MNRLLKTLLVCTLLLVLSLQVQAQEEEEMSRFFRETDWVTWQQGISNPQSVKKLFVRDKEPLDYEALKHFSNLEQLIVYESPIENLNWLKDYPQLKVLEFQGNSLRHRRS